MFQRIIGLDIGSSSIKAVLMQRGLKGFSIERCIEWPLSPAQAAGDRTHFGELLISGLLNVGVRRTWASGGSVGSSREKFVVSVPHRLMFTHRISLPFSNAQQVASTVPYELEGHIPVDLEEVVVDYHPIRDSGSGSGNGQATTVLAFAIRKEYLLHHLDELHKAGVDPVAFEPDVLALYNFSQQYLKDVEGDLALLDIGAGKTSICIVGEGNPRLIRTVWMGGRHLTQAVAGALQISWEQAEEKKKGVVLRADGTDGPISQAVKTALEPLLKELATTFHVYEVETGRSIRHLYICGGASNLPGLSSYLAGQLGQDLIQNPVEIPGGGSYTVGIGLALKECLGQRASKVRFRSGEFAYGKEQAQARSRMVILGAVGIVLLLLAGGNLYLRYHLKEARYEGLRSQVRGLFQQTLPQVKVVVNEVEQLKAAQKEIDKKVGFFGSGTVTTLDLLAELTLRMPQGVVIEVQELLIEQDSVRMEAETDSFEAVERFKAQLEGYPGFREVTISDAKTSADQSKVRFRINITLAEGI